MADNLTYEEATKEADVFMITGEEDLDEGPVHLFNNVDDVDDHLRGVHMSLDPHVRVLHGIMTSAHILPSDFKGRTAFVVICSPNDPFSATVVESGSSTPAELAEEIEGFLSTGAMGMATIPDIDDIYIFYGYEVSVCLAVNWDELDDEALYRCQQVGEDVVKIGDKLLGKEDS